MPTTLMAARYFAMYRVYVFVFQVVYRVVATEMWHDSGGGGDEYCEMEIFQPKCTEGEVVVITNARYGRMSPGRCVGRDYGYLGCSTDVLDLADSWCSGRSSCQIPVPNSAFKRRVDCPKDLKPYFEVAYHCLQVEMASGQVCSESTFLVPSSRSGYLSSHIALETNRGSQDCPWLIRTDPGRRVVINLIDFDYGQAERTNSMSNEYELCTVYAIVRERNTPSGVTVCAGTVRNKTVYTSVSHMVEVQILGRRGSFLLKYEVFGCADPVAPDNTWLKRRDDMAFIGCQAKGKTWQLRCTGSVWEGDVGNCTREPAAGFANVEIILMTIAAVALCVGFLLVCFGLCCMKRKRAKRKANGKPNPNGTNGRANGTILQASTGTGSMVCNTGNLPPPPPFLINHEYAYISDMPPPPPPSPSPPPTKAPSYVHFSGESPTACPSGKWSDSRDTSPLSPADTVHSARLSQNGGASYDLVATGASGSSNVVVAPIRDQPYRTSGLRTATISIGRPRDPLATTTRNGYGTLNRHREPGSSPKYGYSPTYFQVEPDLMAGMYSVRQGRCLQPPEDLPALTQETLPVNFSSKNVTL